MSIHVQSGLFGMRIAAIAGLAAPPPSLVQTVGDHLFAATRLTSAGCGGRRAPAAMPEEQAYAIFIDLPDGRIELRDLRVGGEFDPGASFDLLQLYVPHAALVQHAIRTGRAFDALDCLDKTAVTDAQIVRLGQCLLPCLANDAAAGFVEGIVLALYTHLIAAHAAATARAYSSGGLAPWQQRKAEAMLTGDLAAPPDIAEVARGCRLSVSHFGRAFRRSNGASPHQWLMQRRVGHAKALLEQGAQSLANVALECGFADQSHFTRVFAQRTGVTPGRWRRVCGGGAT